MLEEDPIIFPCLEDRRLWGAEGRHLIDTSLDFLIPAGPKHDEDDIDIAHQALNHEYLLVLVVLVGITVILEPGTHSIPERPPSFPPTLY